MNINVILLNIAFCLILTQPSWASQYQVTIDTSLVQGKAGALSFDFTSNDPFTNSVSILNFTHDGVTGLPETQGGLIIGDIILLLNPAPFTFIQDGSFFNHLSVPFTSFGTSVTFVVQTTEVPPFTSDLPDEMSLFILGTDNQVMFETTDPLGANSIVSLCIDGTSTGILNVFEPAVESPLNVINVQIPFADIIFINSFE